MAQTVRATALVAALCLGAPVALAADVNPSASVFSITDFGARPVLPDNTLQIRRACAAATARGDLLIFVPSGTYAAPGLTSADCVGLALYGPGTIANASVAVSTSAGGSGLSGSQAAAVAVAGTALQPGGVGSALQVTPALPGAGTRSVAARAADTVNVRDFGAAGNAFVVPISADAAAGALTLSFAAGTLPTLAIGESMQGSGIPSGTIVTGFTGTSVTMSGSSGLGSAQLLGTPIDFAMVDDEPAFAAAEASVGNCGTIYVPPGRYWLAENPPQTACLRYRLDGASFTGASMSVPNFTDQSMVHGLLTSGLSGQFGTGSQQAVETLSGYAVPVVSRQSYQNNVQQIRLTNAQPYTSWTDGGGVSHVATHDQVGQFIVAEDAPGNTNGALWDSNWVLGVDAGSNGGAILQEAQVINNRTSAVPELDSINPVTGFDWIFDGTVPDAEALLIQGNTTGGGPGLQSGVLFRYGSVADDVLAVRLAGYRNAQGVVTTHEDYLELGADGHIFAQTLHIGGGTTNGTVLPATGLSVDASGNVTAPTLTSLGVVNAPGFQITGNASGAIALGSKTAVTYPTVDFYQDGNGDDCQLRGAGGANLDLFCNGTNDVIFYAGGAAFQVSPSVPNLTINNGGKVFLDSNQTVSVQEAGGDVVISSGATRLFSIDTTTGNVVAKGTITQSGSP